MPEKSAKTKTDDVKAEIEAIRQDLEKVKTILIEGFELLEEESRPVFGWGPHMARLYEAIVKRLRKELLGDE